MERINPATGETIETYDEQVEERLSRAESTFKTFRDWSVADRESKFAEIATLHRERTTEYAELMTRELSEAEIKEFANHNTVWHQQPATSDKNEVPAE